jgi:nitrate reductase alpha subunit
VRITRAEPGGVGGEPLWRPAKEGVRPGYETAAMKRYLAGDLAAGEGKKEKA